MAEASVTGSGSKRLKVSTACDECRRKKIKCDDSYPCVNCRKSYGDQATSTCNKSGSSERGAASMPANPRSRRRESSQRSSITRNIVSKAPLRPRQDAPTSSLSGQPNVQESGLATLGLVGDETLSAAAYFGGSSVRSFLQRIQAMIQNDPEIGQETASSWWRNYFYGPTVSAKAAMANGNLPSRSFADQLFEVYWNHVHPIYPWLDRQQVDADYNSLWSGEQTICDTTTIRCTVYSILALATQISTEIVPSERQDLAERLYAAGVSSFNANTDRTSSAASVATVQCYLLRCQYVQSTDAHEEFWLLSGMAARIAFGIGLHLPRMSERAPDEKPRQLLRRVFHGCVMMDRIAALTFGRPMVVHECEVPLPVAKTAADLGNEGDVCVFVETCRLFRIFQDALKGIYPLHTQSSRMEDLLSYISTDGPGPPTGRLVLSLDFELVEWRKNLPQHLQDREVPSRQQTILQQRYLYLKIIGLRPILSTYLHTSIASVSHAGRPSEDLLALRYARQSCLLCIELAQASIDLIYDSHDRSIEVLSEWWYNVLYIYVAATVLVAAQLLTQAPSAADNNIAGIEVSWRKVMALMVFYKPYRGNISQLKHTLELLWDGLPARYREIRRAREALHKESSTGAGSTAPLGTGASSSATDTAAESREDGGEASAFQADANPFDLQQVDLAGFGFDLDDMSWLHDLPTFEEY